MHYVPVSLRGTRTAKLQCVPAFALDSFECQAEAFLRARAWREWNFLSGQRPGRGLITLYDQDFPSFTSTDLWNDLQAASPEEPGQHQALSSLLAAANLEGRTRDFAVKVAGIQARATIPFEDKDIPWREAPARWALLPEVPRPARPLLGHRRIPPLDHPQRPSAAFGHDRAGHLPGRLPGQPRDANPLR